MSPLARKLALAAAIAANPLVAEANSLAVRSPTMEEARVICATTDQPVESRTYIYACMSFYLSYMRGIPAAWKAPFQEDLAHLARAQTGYEKKLIGFDGYFALVRDHTCKIAERFKSMAQIDWAMGEVVVGVAQMVQEQAAGNRDARIPMEVGEDFKGCKAPSLTS